MKIGILTFHRCINYGSYWQARCLTDAIQKCGHHAVVLNHQSRRVDIAEWKCALQPVLPTFVPKSDYPLYRQKIERFSGLIKSLPISPPFQLDHPEQMENYDLVIVGSDEVWNLSHPWYGFYPVFYGEGIPARRLISYAASFGNYNPSGTLDTNWIKRLQKFDKISVRDENSQAIIRNSLGYESQIVLDPCLQFPSVIKEQKYSGNGRYAVIYGHNFSEPVVRNCRIWAARMGIILISIGYRNHWADQQRITADPLEFASLFSQAAAVITNFFHGCIFALLYSKPFVCESSGYRSNKIHDLLKMIQGEKYLISELTLKNIFYDLLSYPLDENIHKNINSLRKSSDLWLNQALESNQL